MSCHAAVQRGLMTTPDSNLTQGRFGRMFRNPPPAHRPEKKLEEIAKEMIGEGADVDNKLEEPDAEENSAIPVGYTYLGQFLDHDITFDPQSSIEKLNDPAGVLGTPPTPGATWRMRFWMGGWDADALCGFVRGSASALGSRENTPAHPALSLNPFQPQPTKTKPQEYQSHVNQPQ